MYFNIIHYHSLFLPSSPNLLKQYHVTDGNMFCVCMLDVYAYIACVISSTCDLCLWTWLTLLNIMISSYTHLPTDNIISFFFMTEYYPIVRIYLIYM
jgi:hypothetical protein